VNKVVEHLSSKSKALRLNTTNDKQNRRQAKKYHCINCWVFENVILLRERKQKNDKQQNFFNCWS
jgi:hypothetical protein